MAPIMPSWPKRKPLVNGKAASSDPDLEPRPDQSNTSDASISASDYALKCRELMKLSKDLRTMGSVSVVSHLVFKINVSQCRFSL
jgi:hypothetical protein